MCLRNAQAVFYILAQCPITRVVVTHHPDDLHAADYIVRL